MIYYNEHDPFAAAWLRELIAAGHIAFGVVDERSIEDVLPAELMQFKQCHFFAGIGVWSYALRRAGWPDDRQVWTGSCPCQPFSAAGKGDGFADERHLWPAFHHLIEQCKPDVVFGEQVASKDGLAWIDLVLADLEGTGYAAGAVDTCSAGFGAPHIRQRLYWVADSNKQQRDGCGNARSAGRGEFADDRAIGGVANPESGRVDGSLRSDERENISEAMGRGVAGGMENPQLPAQPRLGLVGGEIVREQEAGGFAGTGVVGGLCAVAGSAGMLRGEEFSRLGDTEHNGRITATVAGSNGQTILDNTGGAHDTEQFAGAGRSGDVPEAFAAIATRPTNGHWRDADWLFCRDGKWRPVEPGTFPLAHGAAARVGRLRGYGNALNAEQAQGFIEAYMSAAR